MPARQRGQAHLPDLELIQVEFIIMIEGRSDEDQPSSVEVSRSGRWACPRWSITLGNRYPVATAPGSDMFFSVRRCGGGERPFV
jgi:hypothetical protein